MKRSPGRKQLQTIDDAVRDSIDKDKPRSGLSKVNSSMDLAVTGFKFENQQEKQNRIFKQRNSVKKITKTANNIKERPP